MRRCDRIYTEIMREQLLGEDTARVDMSERNQLVYRLIATEDVQADFLFKVTVQLIKFHHSDKA